MARFNHYSTYYPQVRREYDRIGQIIQAIIASHITADYRIDDVAALERDLNRYGASLETWANEFWGELLNRQTKRLASDWRLEGYRIQQNDPFILQKSMQLQYEQVSLIKTLCRNAAYEAQMMAQEYALATGQRAEQLADRLQGRNAGYPAYAARRLARTEISKAQSTLVQAQAEAADVTHFIWRTAGDSDVRDAHAELDGKVFEFAKPPYIPGEGAHLPGQIWNCRCYAEPLITEVRGNIGMQGQIEGQKAIGYESGTNSNQ